MTNTTDAGRNTQKVATANDVIELKFYSAKEVPSAAVIVTIDDVSGEDVGGPTLIATDNNYPITGPEGEALLGTLYTYRINATTSWPLDGQVSYAVNMDGAETLSNIVPPDEANMFFDNTLPEMTYSLGAPSANNIGITLNTITDNYLTDMSITNFPNYTLNFYASNSTHVLNTNVPHTNINLNQTYFIEGLNSESFYNIYASITDPFGNTRSDILPSASVDGRIETNDITRPVIADLTAVSIANTADQAPGLKVTLKSHDTATANGHSYTLYVGVFDSDLGADEATLLSKLQAKKHFTQVFNNATAQETTVDVYDFFTTASADPSLMMPEKEFFVHAVAQDDAGNIVLSKTTHIVDNTIQFTSIVSDFSDNYVAQPGNNLTMVFTSQYKLLDATNLDVTVAGTSIVPTSADGLTWTAVRPIDLNDVSGQISFSVSQVTDIGTTTSAFSSADVTFRDIYIQIHRPPLPTVSPSPLT